jgi:hypothetical protein
MDYEQLIKGAARYGLEDNIYDLASLMVSRHGIKSKEAVAGVFVLIFSWNRFYYTPPSPGRRKPIEVLDRHIKEFEKTLETEEKYLSALKDKSLENVNFDEKLPQLKSTVGSAIIHLFSRFGEFLGSTGASKALHLLLPKLIVLWDTQIREDYGVGAGADDFLKFQKMMRQLLDNAIADFMIKQKVKREEAIQGILRLRYGTENKSPAKLLDEFNWATRGESKRHLLG